MPRSPRIGVTGGIGSGKSTVVAIFAARGAAVIDSDSIARELSGPGGGAVEAIAAQFGSQVLDAQRGLDRAQMRARVFSDPGQRALLEAILHPRIRDRSLELAAAREGSAPLLVFDIPLLAEASDLRRELALDRVLVIDCPVALQRERALARGSLSAAQVDAVIASQAGRSQRLDIADDVLVNAASLEALQARVERLWRAYCPARSV